MRVRESAGAVLLVALIALAGPPLCDGASFTVDDQGEASDADTGDPACATAGAVCTLRAALEQANALGGPHTITLPAGTYVQSATLPAVAQDVMIVGEGFATTIVRSSDTGRPRLLEVPAAGGLALTGIQLTNAAVGPGSAILATGGAVLLDGCLVAGNVGGAVLGEAATPLGTPARITTNGTIFAGNTGGTALEASDSYELVVNDSVFDQNQQTSNGLGGAIAISGTGTGRVQTIASSAFSTNTAGGGGAISITSFSGAMTIAASTFAGNVTGTLAGNGGGAILSFKPGLVIVDSTFSANMAAGPSQNGGAILSPQIAFRATGCTFNDNGATATGGAICATGMTILNSTFTANTAGTSGGAIYVDNPTLPNALSLGNATVVGNSALAVAGGGVRGGGASVRVGNSIVAGNDAPTGPDCTGTVVSQGYNVIGLASGCSFASATGDQVGSPGTPIDPVVGALSSGNGGATATMALQPGSPALDHGDPAGCRDFATPSNVLATDQRGEPRTTDGDGDGTAVCDVGAFEREAVPVSSSSSTTGVPTTSVTSSTTSGSTTTSTTLPAPVCTGGVGFTKAALVIRRGAPPSGDERLRFTGTLDLPPGRPAAFDPRNTGAQLSIEDLGRGGAAVFDLSHRTMPIPPGAGCDGRDGWKRTRYVNVSGRIDPPACTPGSANGLRGLRFKDRRGKGRGIAVLGTTKRSSIGPLIGPFRITVVLGASVVASTVGDCGEHGFAACSTRRSTIRCP